MAPNKFEKHIKKELEQREIQPSAKAWERISSELEASSQPKKKNYFWYVAASLIGLLIASTVYFKSSGEPIEQSIQVVENPDRAEEGTQGIVETTVEVVSEQFVDHDEAVEEQETNEPMKSNQVQDTKKVLAEVGQDKTMKDKLELPLEKSEELINTKIWEVVAQVDLLEQQNEALTDAEVDSLLRKAQQEILSNRLFRDDRSVDAMALLSEVEDELDKSFRDQIFESLKSGFIKVRTAVADRNN